MSSGDGTKKKSRFPLINAMTEGKPQQQFVEKSGDNGAAPNGAGGADDRRMSHGHKPNLVSNTTARLANPLGDLTEDEVMQQAQEFAMANDLPVETFRKGGLLAKSPQKWQSIKSLTEDERRAIERETTHKYDQPWILYNLVIACSVAAAVQGMDESVISYVAVGSSSADTFQRSSDVFPKAVWRRPQSLKIQPLDSRPCQRRTVPLLWCHRMLDD